MTRVVVVSLQTLLEDALASPHKNLAGDVRAIEDLFSPENRKVLKQHFPGIFAFLSFHPGADSGITSYIRTGTLSSDAGQNIMALFTFDSRATAPTVLRDQSFRSWLALTTTVHPSYTLVRSMFKDPVVLNFPGVIFFEDFLQEQNPIYIHISDSSNEDAVRQQMRSLFALANKAYQSSWETGNNFLDLFAQALQKERIDYERGRDVSLREWFVNAFRILSDKTSDIVSIVSLFK